MSRRSEQRRIDPLRRRVDPRDLVTPAVSWAGVVFRLDDQPLPGSLNCHQYSLRCGTEQLARRWLDDTIHASLMCGFQVGGYIQPLDGYPEFFAHCPNGRPIAVGHACPRCREFVSVEAAWQYARNRMNSQPNQGDQS